MSFSIVNITRYTNPSNLGADTFTIPTTTAGNLLVVMAIGFATGGAWAPPGVTADNDTLTEVPFYTVPAFFPFSAPLDMGSFPSSLTSADVWWCKTQGGTTSISFTCGLNPYFWVYEISGSTIWAVDNFDGTGADNSSQQPVVGPTISGAGSDVYFSVVATANGSTTAVNAPWTLDPVAIIGNAPAYILGSAGNQQATFTDDNGNDAFTIVGVSFTATPPPALVNACFNFQDPAGNPLAFGTVTFDLNVDIAKTGSPGDQIAKGRKVTALLDANGSVCLNLWPNTTLTSGAFASANRTGSLYFVQAFTAEGQPAWSGQMTLDASGNITWILQ